MRGIEEDETYTYHPKNILARLAKEAEYGRFRVEVRQPEGRDPCGLVVVTVERSFYPGDQLVHDWHALAGELGCGIDFVEVDALPPCNARALHEAVLRLPA